jgi:hypothetical protein
VNKEGKQRDGGGQHEEKKKKGKRKRRKWLDGKEREKEREREKRPYIRARLSINDPPGNNTQGWTTHTHTLVVARHPRAETETKNACAPSSNEAVSVFGV